MSVLAVVMVDSRLRSLCQMSPKSVAELLIWILKFLWTSTVLELKDLDLLRISINVNQAETNVLQMHGAIICPILRKKVEHNFSHFEVK